MSSENNSAPVRRSIATVVLLLLTVSSTSLASGRGGGGIGWWEKMSGPGPWLGGWYSHSKCLKNWDRDAARAVSGSGPAAPSQPDAAQDTGQLDLCFIDDRTLWLNLGGSIMWTGASERPELTHGVLWAVSFEPSVDYRIHKIGRIPIYVGAGLGIHLFRGDNEVSFERASFEARVGFVYPRLFGSRVYAQLLYTPRYFGTGFTAADFGTGTYDSNGGEWIHAATLSLNFDW